MDALARQFAATHDMKVKEEIERLSSERVKLYRPGPWTASARHERHLAGRVQFDPPFFRVELRVFRFPLRDHVVDRVDRVVLALPYARLVHRLEEPLVDGHMPFLMSTQRGEEPIPPFWAPSGNLLRSAHTGRVTSSVT